MYEGCSLHGYYYSKSEVLVTLVTPMCNQQLCRSTTKSVRCIESLWCFCLNYYMINQSVCILYSWFATGINGLCSWASCCCSCMLFGEVQRQSKLQNRLLNVYHHLLGVNYYLHYYPLFTLSVRWRSCFIESVVCSYW